MTKIYRINKDNLKQVVKDMPTFSGIYGFLNREGSYLYIGQSINLRARIRKHATTFLKQLMNEHGASKIITIQYPENVLDDVEQDAIDIHAPRFNKQHAKDGVLFEITMTLPRYKVDQLQDVCANDGLSVDQVFRDFITETIKRGQKNNCKVPVEI